MRARSRADCGPDGVPASFTGVYEQFFADIHRYIAGRLGRDVADDIAADTFVIALRKHGSFDAGRGPVRAWLFGIATNLVAQHRRAEQRRYRALGRVRAEEPAGGHEDRVLSWVAAAQMRPQLARALARLSPEERDVLLLVALVKYADLGSLPRSPKALDRYLGRLLPSSLGPVGDREFLIIEEMLTAYEMPPALTAEFYRALGGIPGITVDTHAVDVAGRHGVAFTLKKPVALGVTPEIIVNPRTYQLMASEVLIPRTPGSAGPAVSAAGTAILQKVPVSGPGIRP